MFAPILPRLGFDALHPPDTVFAPRSSVERTHWFGLPPWRLDALTGTTIACMGSMPLICHAGVATEVALSFLESAGLTRPKSLLLYRDEREAVARARECVSAGMRLAYIYPPPPGADADEMLLVPLDAYGSLNDKARLGELVASLHVPPRRIVAPDEIAGLLAAWPGRPVFVKGAIRGAHGAGRDVRRCASAAEWTEAIAWLLGERAHLAGVVVEDEIHFVSTWCLSFAVLAAECLYLGAAEQLFSSVGTQSGSRIDPRHPPPQAAVAVAQAIAERARGLGYRGICGFDVGVDADGHVFAFDLNFRSNASTPQVLMHDAATRRIGAAVSQSFTFRLKGSLEAALDPLRAYAEEGRLVPLRIYDGAFAPAPEGCNIVSGLLVAGDSAAADELAAELASRVEPLAAPP